MSTLDAKARTYLENQVYTSNREQLLLMLVDGAVRFAEQARAALEEKRLDAFCEKLIRGQRIVVELMSSLRKDPIGEELYNHLTGLYYFIYRRFVQAATERQTPPLDEGLQILRSVRDMWHEAVQKERAEKAAPRGGAAPPKPQPLNIQG